MAKKIHVYNITVSPEEQFKKVRIEGAISSKYAGTAMDFILVKNEDGQTVELTKYQIVKAELINVEEQFINRSRLLPKFHVINNDDLVEKTQRG